MPQEYSGIIMLVVFFGIMYFTMIRPQKKKDKEIKSMRESLAIGVKVNDEVVTLEMAFGKQRIDFSKWAVGSVAKKGKEKAVKAEVEETVEDKEEEDK